jgi:hypothetical protein
VFARRRESTSPSRILTLFDLRKYFVFVISGSESGLRCSSPRWRHNWLLRFLVHS